LHTIREGHSDWIRKVTVNAKGNLLATASKDESVIVWSIDKMKSSKDQSQQGDAIIALLREHEN